MKELIRFIRYRAARFSYRRPRWALGVDLTKKKTKLDRIEAISLLPVSLSYIDRLFSVYVMR